MVNSPWKGQCAACPQAEKQIKAHHFEICQWQKSSEPNLWYILYRWFFAATFLGVCLYSIFHRVSGDGSSSLWKWPAFLTNWAYLVCTLQAVLALWIVQSSWIYKNSPKDTNRKIPKLYHVYWALHNLAVDMALVVSLIYWALVHDSAVHRLDALNFLMHGCNSLLMLLDAFLVRHPCRLKFILNAFGVGCIYSIFSYIYFIAGGTDRNGRPYIYSSLDWRKPGKAVCFTLLSLTILSVIHCVAYCLYRVRVRLAQRTTKPPPELPPHEKPMLIEMV